MANAAAAHASCNISECVTERLKNYSKLKLLTHEAAIGFHLPSNISIQHRLTFAFFDPQQRDAKLHSHCADLLCRGLGEPFQAVVKAFTSLGHAAACCDITDRQVVGAAVDLVLTAGGLSQRAAGPSEAVAKVLPHAAACAPCTHINPDAQYASSLGAVHADQCRFDKNLDNTNKAPE